VSSPVSVLIARFPHGHSESPDITDWLVETMIKAHDDLRISRINHIRIDDTPITMGRNQVLYQAQINDSDIVVMIDSDIKPDAYLRSNPNRIGQDDTAVPFWDTALDCILESRERDEIAVIGAPYCGPPPIENVYVFHWDDLESYGPGDEYTNFKLSQYSRHAVTTMKGIQTVAALPTGLIMLDVRALSLTSPPYTYYEWSDKYEMEKSSTEDVTFTRDLSLNGARLYCTWSSWAGHWKRKCVGKPAVLTGEQMSHKFREALRVDILRELNIENGEKIVHVERKTITSSEPGRPQQEGDQAGAACGRSVG
jgi:hypothetical protein